MLSKRISIKVKAGSREEKVLPSPKGWVISVKSPAKEGKANEAIINVIAKHFSVSKSRVRIKSGLRSKNKIVEII